MIWLNRTIFVLLAALWLAASGPAAAAEAVWLPFDALSAGDRSIAEQALAGLFGEDPDLWPDWLDPRAIVITAGRSDTLLIVREPYRAPCGQFLFLIFGPPGTDGTRSRLGDGFCAGTLGIAPQRFQSMPDLIFSEGRRKDAADGLWKRVDQRVRWTANGWVTVDTGPAPGTSSNPFSGLFGK
ncbi:MAG: hypothetical protein F8N37_11930 [Telmatospirillum sp.]|nr:hypothetical protein [Telmatospirillum sp.]